MVNGTEGARALKGQQREIVFLIIGSYLCTRKSSKIYNMFGFG
jgi:hypothetical protein